ncbi:23S rRNA (guanosine(2251)-2'-O)-methyltransferase RlmB [Mycoplasma miroungirhinis]|uniref:23S rRNA (guanosine(2251)-2'-O)-methyltransferase RlmB n=1 Tax=Mycoplasma miroungirhinis TaxID=754516 RepID=UPI001F02BA23|nr:23S rRNA (guanosine(2251)-2'-O)-methyltransferase RlmB [Mycoplasma miroungirhinis]
MKSYLTNIIVGKNSVFDALENGFNVEKIFVQKNINMKINFHNIEYVSKEKLNDLTDQNHQGIIAVIKPFNYADFNELVIKKPQQVIILDHIQDPHNLGAIMRSANVFDLKWIILPKDRAASVNATALKISSGGFNGLKIIKVPSLNNVINKLKEIGYWVYATSLDKNSVNINDVKFNSPTVLIIGNEQKGVSNTLLKLSDQNIYIPQYGTVQSLNASVAAGICFYCLKNK